MYRTWSTYARGAEVLMATYAILDLVPLGRDERDVDYKMAWLRHHDRYQEGAEERCQGSRAGCSSE